jgi:hypothetical protein
VSTVAIFQTIAAALSALTALVGLLIALRNFPKLLSWFKSKAQIIAERDKLRADNITMAQSAAIAHQAAADVKMSVDSLRAMNEELRERVDQIESVIPRYEAMMEWIPPMLDYAVWLEMIAKEGNLDLGGREMPQLPKVVMDHIKRNGGSR